MFLKYERSRLVWWMVRIREIDDFNICFLLYFQSSIVIIVKITRHVELEIGTPI